MNDTNIAEYEIGDVQYHIERVFDDMTPIDSILVNELQKFSD